MSHQMAFEGLHAVVAEDSQHMRTLLRSMLRALGFAKVAAESNGADALRVITDGWPDVILLDWNMPGLSGIDVFRAIRALPDPLCRVPVMMVTAHASPERLLLSRKLGVNSFLCKPVSIEALEPRLLKIIQDPHLLHHHDAPRPTFTKNHPAPEPAKKAGPVKTATEGEGENNMESFYA